MAFICSTDDYKFAYENNNSNNLISSKIQFNIPNPSYKVLKVNKNDSKVEYEISKSNCYTKNNIPNWINITLFSENLNKDKSNLIYVLVENQIQTKILLKEKENASIEKRKLILYSHENGTDLFRILPFLIDLSIQIKCDIISYDYEGFGRSNGKASENSFINIYQYIIDIILNKFKYQIENILLMGRDIGVMNSIAIASRNKYLKCKGLILISPKISEKRIDINAMKSIICPTLLILSKKEENDGEEFEVNPIITFCREINNEKEWFPKDKIIYDNQSLFFEGDFLLKHRKKFISFIREYMKSDSEENNKSRLASISTHSGSNIENVINSVEDIENEKGDNKIESNINFNNEDY